MTDEEYISIDQACEYVGVSKIAMNEAIRKRDIKSKIKQNTQYETVCKKSVAEYFEKPIEEKPCKTLGLVQAAKFLGVSRLEFFKLINDGAFKTTGEGFDSQIKVSDLEAYLSIEE